MRDTPAISVVIPMYNAADTIGAQLVSLAALDPAPVEVVLVDNESTDDSVAVATEAGRTLSSLVVLSCARRGANAARNDGVAACSGSHVAFLDADDRVDQRWYEQVTAMLPWDAMVGSLQHCDVVDDRWHPRGEPRLASYPHPFLPDICTASAGVRVAVWEQLGGFDESYSQGADDTEFFWRVMLAGYEVAEIPEAVVWYRARSGLRAVWSQRWRHGLAEARLQREFREHGWEPRFLREQFTGVAAGTYALARGQVDGREWFERVAAASGATYGHVTGRTDRL